MMAATTPDLFFTHRANIARLLSEIPDPEIPVVSITDLGMIIDIAHENSRWIISMAPTYSGCPAIDVIPIMIKSRMEEEGVSADVRITLSPPWSTDWISEAGHAKLQAFGIAPPRRMETDAASEGRPRQCPQCGSSHVQLISQFSSTPCKAAYKCLDCAEPFEYFKCY